MLPTFLKKFLHHFIYLSITMYIYHPIFLSPYPSITLSFYHHIHLSLYLHITIPIHHSIFLSPYPSITLFTYHQIYPSLYLSITLSFYHSIFLSLYVSMYLSLYLFFIYNSIYSFLPSIIIFVYLSIYLSITIYICQSINRYSIAADPGLVIFGFSIVHRLAILSCEVEFYPVCLLQITIKRERQSRRGPDRHEVVMGPRTLERRITEVWLHQCLSHRRDCVVLAG